MNRHEQRAAEAAAKRKAASAERQRIRRLIEKDGFESALCIVARDLLTIGIGHQLDFLMRLQTRVKEQNETGILGARGPELPLSMDTGVLLRATFNG